MVEVDDVSDAVTVTTALDDNVYARAFLWVENMKPIAFAEWKKSDYIYEKSSSDACFFHASEPYFNFSRNGFCVKS